MEHNDIDGILRTSSGAIETRSTALNVRNIADGDYVDVNANAFNEVSEPLPDDPENWKELLPEFLKLEVTKNIIEKYIVQEEREVLVPETYDTGEVDKKGNPIFAERDVLTIIIVDVIKTRIIGTDTRTGISIGKTARLALREVESLKTINTDLLKRIEVLEKAVGGIE